MKKYIVVLFKYVSEDGKQPQPGTLYHIEIMAHNIVQAISQAANKEGVAITQVNGAREVT